MSKSLFHRHCMKNEGEPFYYLGEGPFQHQRCIKRGCSQLRSVPADTPEDPDPFNFAEWWWHFLFSEPPHRRGFPIPAPLLSAKQRLRRVTYECQRNCRYCRKEADRTNEGY